MHPKKRSKMVFELIIAWVLGVVAFFVLWAILLKVIQRITKKKADDAQTYDETPDNNQSINTKQ